MAKKKNAKQIVQNKNEGDKQGLEMESDEELLETSVVPETSLSVSRTLGEEDSPASPKVNEEEDEVAPKKIFACFLAIQVKGFLCSKWKIKKTWWKL